MAASAVLLLLIATCCTLLRRQPTARHATPPHCCPKQSSASRHARPANRACSQRPGRGGSQHGEDDARPLSYEVDDLDTLAEIEVFLEFGYLEQAAIALRSYVDGSSINAPASSSACPNCICSCAGSTTTATCWSACTNAACWTVSN
jgi:hypothetical protein